MKRTEVREIITCNSCGDVVVVTPPAALPSEWGTLVVARRACGAATIGKPTNTEIDLCQKCFHRIIEPLIEKTASVEAEVGVVIAVTDVQTGMSKIWAS